MAGNEKYLVPELVALINGKRPETSVYADPDRCERFEGAKRGGSPNLAKLGNACRFLDKTKNYKKLGFEDPEQEFMNWMDYESEMGWMWNEQGPSPVYDWMHLLPQLVYCVYGGPLSASMSNEWVIHFLKALDLGYIKTQYGLRVVQCGMRGVTDEEQDHLNEWIIEYARTGKVDNGQVIPWMQKNDLFRFIVDKTGDLLQRLYAAHPDSWWPVRVEQTWLRFDDGVVAYLAHDGNGNTQAKAFEGVWTHGTNIELPVNGFRKQGHLDKMECIVNTEDMVVTYKSELFTGNKYVTYQMPKGSKLLNTTVWNQFGMKFIDATDPFDTPKPTPPPQNTPVNKPKKRKWSWLELMGN